MTPVISDTVTGNLDENHTCSAGGATRRQAFKREIFMKIPAISVAIVTAIVLAPLFNSGCELGREASKMSQIPLPSYSIILWDSTSSMIDLFKNPDNLNKAVKIAQEWSECGSDTDTVDVYQLAAAHPAYQHEDDIDKFQAAKTADALMPNGSSDEVSDYVGTFSDLGALFDKKDSQGRPAYGLQRLVVVGDLLNYPKYDLLDTAQNGKSLPAQPVVDPRDNSIYENVQVVLIHPADSHINYKGPEGIEQWWRTFFNNRHCADNNIKFYTFEDYQLPGSCP
jgi:hypothetical protein